MPIQVAYVPASKSCPYTHNKFWLSCQVLVRNTTKYEPMMCNCQYQLSSQHFLVFDRFDHKGWNASSQNVPIPTEPKTACESDFEMLSWTLMQWSVCNGNALPSDMRTIRGSQAFKVSITILTHASSKWSFSLGQVIEHEIGDEKEISVHRGGGWLQRRK